MQIHVDRGGERFGPYSLEDVNRYLADGTLMPSDIGWHEGAMDWVPLTQIAGVKAGGGPSSSSGPPAPTAADAAGASSSPGPPAAPTAANAAKPKAPEAMGAATESGKGKGGALKIVAIVLLLAGLGAGGYFFIYPKYFAKSSGDDNNGTSKTAAAWQTMPDGVPIVGGTDVIMQIKVAEIFNSPLVQQQFRAMPAWAEIINIMQQQADLTPGDLQDLTLSMSGVSAVAQSASKDSKVDIDAAIKSGKVKIGVALRTSKPVDKTKIEALLKEIEAKEKTQGETKYYVFKSDKADEPPFTAYLADEKTVVGGPESVVKSHIDLAGKLSARSGLEFLDSKQQITIAYVPPDNTAIEKLVTTAMAEMTDVPQGMENFARSVKEMLEPIKKVEAAALSGGLTGNGLQLVASANFPDVDTAKSFADNFNKMLKDAQQIPDVAQFFLAAQGMGVMVPSAESKEKQASLTLAIPMNAIQSLGGMIGGLAGGSGSAGHSQDTVKRWALLSQTVGGNQWPSHKVVQQNLGNADKVTENVTMNTRTVLSAGAVIQNARNTSQVPRCIRWDYFDAPQGQRAIHLYFFQQTGQLIGVHWFEAGPRKIGPPQPNGGGGGRPARPEGGSLKGSRPKGGKKGSRPKGAQQRGAGGQAGSNTPPQSAAEAQQRLKGSWTSSSGGGVTLVFGDNNRFSTDAGSGPKTGKYRILAVSGNNIQFTGLHAANIATITLNGPGEFTVRQTSMLGVVPKGTFKRK